MQQTADSINHECSTPHNLTPFWECKECGQGWEHACEPPEELAEGDVWDCVCGRRLLLTFDLP